MPGPHTLLPLSQLARVAPLSRPYSSGRQRGLPPCVLSPHGADHHVTTASCSSSPAGLPPGNANSLRVRTQPGWFCPPPHPRGPEQCPLVGTWHGCTEGLLEEAAWLGCTRPHSGVQTPRCSSAHTGGRGAGRDWCTQASGLYFESSEMGGRGCSQSSASECSYSGRIDGVHAGTEA